MLPVRRLQALAHAFLCFVGSLRGCGLLLALVLFTGCAHFGIIPLISLGFARKKREIVPSGNSMRIIPKTAAICKQNFAKGKK